MQNPRPQDAFCIMVTAHESVNASQPSAYDRRMVALLNGDIVSDSESDHVEEYVGLQSLTSERAKRLVAKKICQCSKNAQN